MTKRIRVQSKNLLGEGQLETVLETVEGQDVKIGDPIFTMFPETGNKHVACTIVEILDETLVAA